MSFVVFSWPAVTMLAIEASGKVMVRILKFVSGDGDALAEVDLMMGEKAIASYVIVVSLCTGTTPAMVVAHLRRRVAANAARLGTGMETRRCASPSLSP